MEIIQNEIVELTITEKSEIATIFQNIITNIKKNHLLNYLDKENIIMEYYG